MLKKLETLSDEEILIHVFGNYTKGMSAYEVYRKLQKLGLDEYRINSCINTLHENTITMQYTKSSSFNSDDRGNDYSKLYYEIFDPLCDSVNPNIIWHEPSKSYNIDHVYTKFRLDFSKVFRSAKVNKRDIDKLTIKSCLNIFGILKLLLTRLRTIKSSVYMISQRPDEYRKKLYSSTIIYNGVEYSIRDLYILHDANQLYLCRIEKTKFGFAFFDIENSDLLIETKAINRKPSSIYLEINDKTAIPLVELIPYSIIEESNFCLDISQEYITKKKGNKSFVYRK